MIYRNDVLEHTDTGNRLRVIDINYEDQSIWLFRMGEGKHFPERFQLSVIEEQLGATDKQSGKTLRHLEGVLGTPLHSISTAAAVHRNTIFERIKPLVQTQDIFIPRERNRLIKARATELKCSAQTLYKDLRNWWRGGQTLNALTPCFHTRGSNEGTTSNRGRRPIYEVRPIFQITKSDKENIQDILNTIYLKSDYSTLSDCYQRLLEKYYSYIDNEGAKRIKAPGEIPTEQQFRRVCKKLMPREMVIRRRKGNAEFELNHRAKLGSLIHETYSVGDGYEIDSTIADVLLVFKRDKVTVIGKPSLYLIFDRKSWLIVGFYIGLESPSWPAAMQAILSISEDKEALCKRYGVPYDPADWPAHGVLPKQFIADRGSENLCLNSNQIVDGLECTICTLPSKRADHKPHVECGFKLIQRSIADSTPGYEPPENFQKRQGKHYEKDACLTLDQFTTIILNAIIRFNRSPRENYPWPTEQVLNNCQPIPREIWAMEIRKRAGALSRFSYEQLRFALLPRDEATVSREGIRLGACYYSCPEAMSRGWMIAEKRGTFKVSVSYDRRLVDTILVHDDQDPTKFFTATLLDRCDDYRGLSFAEVAAIEYHRAKLKLDGRAITRQGKQEYHQNVDPLAKDAKAEMKRLAKGKSRTSRKKDIVEIRTAERQMRRQEEARLTPPIPECRPAADVIPFKANVTPGLPPNSLPDQPTDTPLTREQRQRQKRQEMLNGL